MGRSTAVDVFQTYLSCVSDIDKPNLSQVYAKGKFTVFE